MIETVYVEREVRNELQTQAVLGRMPKARVIGIERFGEILNPRRQDFRLQKQQPALILARKHGRKVLPAPDEYGIGVNRNFYFSHMLNCLYDCRYCFLQGMFRSAHYVHFVNWEDFVNEIDTELEHAGDEQVAFYSGYDCDSLALDRLTGFADQALDAFATRPRGLLELRTKSVQVAALERREPIPNCVVAMSFTPQAVSSQLEPGVPAVERRLKVLRGLAERGWQVGLRLDPLIWSSTFRLDYGELLEQLCDELPTDSIHSVSVGVFRMPKPFLKNLTRLYPDDSFLAQEFSQRAEGLGYPEELEAEMVDWIEERLRARLPEDRIFHCTTAQDPTAGGNLTQGDTLG